MKILPVESGTASVAFGAAGMTKAKPITALYQRKDLGTGWEVASLPIDRKSGFISQRHPALIPKLQAKAALAVQGGNSTTNDI